MFRSLDHPQGATLFLAKVTSKTFIKLLYINRVLWQHVVLCKIALLGMRLAMVCVVCYVVRDWLQPVSHYVTHDAHHNQAHSQ